MKTSIALTLLCAMAAQGCSNGLAVPTRAALEEQGALDGRAYHVALVSERGGPPATIDLTFVRGTLVASDARDDGFVPAPYKTTGAEFSAEARSPSAVRRFRGRVANGHVVGTMMLVPHGGAPAVYAFTGDAS